MKVLIITYYWPPAGGSGVQRWLKFVKYLQDFGIAPVVYTVKNPTYPILDPTLENELPNNIEVLRESIWEPNNILSIFQSKKTKQSAGFLNQNPSFFGKLLQYIRANYFIPDARKFWVKPSVNYLKKYLSENAVDAVITSGPPHSLHLIGMQLKEKFGVKWISDFRDPWTEIDYFNQLPLSNKAKQKHDELEQKVLEKSDAVIVIGKSMKENFKKFSNSIHVVSNGFDTVSENKKLTLDKSFSITYVGLMNADRNPKILWKVLAEICSENIDFNNDLEIKLIGEVAEEVDKSIAEFQLKKITKIGYVSHKKVSDYQQQAQILLLTVNDVASAKGIITGKIFEYLQAKRPILAIGPSDGDLAEIISETNSGVIVDFDDATKLKATLLELYRKFKNDSLVSKSKNIEQYHRKKLTEKLSEIIKTTVETPL